jgi:hypothetical protein
MQLVAKNDISRVRHAFSARATVEAKVLLADPGMGFSSRDSTWSVRRFRMSGLVE